MATLKDLTDEIIRGLGRSDSDAVEFARLGVNGGLYAAAILFEPPELKTSETGTAVNAGTAVDLSALTRLLRVDSVYNTTGSQEVFILPHSLLNVLYLPTTGNVNFYSIYGQSLYYRPLPTGDETLTIYFFSYPTRLYDNGDTFPLGDHMRDFVLSFANAYAWANLEEVEDADMWLKINDKLGLPAATLTQVRRLMQKEGL